VGERVDSNDERDALVRERIGSRGARQAEQTEVSKTVGQRGSPGSFFLQARTVARATSPHHARQGIRGAGRPGRGTRMNGSGLFVGIDVAKETLDVAVRPGGERWRVNNDEAGIKQLVGQLLKLAPALIVMEATGGYEAELALALTEAGLGVRVVNPRQVRDFAKGKGLLAKTDSLDAGILAEFAETYRPEARQLLDEQAREMAALLARRRQLLDMRTAEKNRLEHARGEVRKRILAHVAWLESEIDRIERNLDDKIRRSPLYVEKNERLQSVPGVGKQTSLSLILNLPEPQADCRPGRRGALQPGQRHEPRQENGLGRPRERESGALHGSRRRQSPQQGDPGLLQEAPRRGQAEEARPYGLHEKAPDDPQRHDESTLLVDSFARYGPLITSEDLSKKSVADP